MTERHNMLESPTLLSTLDQHLTYLKLAFIAEP